MKMANKSFTFLVYSILPVVGHVWGMGRASCMRTRTQTQIFT
jgi:hypothetical protein